MAALAAGVASGAGEVGKKVVVDAYGALKTAIKKKYGGESKIAQAVSAVEDEPEFKPNQDALAGGRLYGESAVLRYLGTAHSDQWHTEKAIDYYEQALSIAIEVEYRLEEGVSLLHMGNNYARLRQVEKARKYLKESLVIFEEIDSPRADTARDWLTKLKDVENGIPVLCLRSPRVTRNSLVVTKIPEERDFLSDDPLDI